MTFDEFVIARDMLAILQLLGFLAAWGLAMLTALVLVIVIR